jgi:cyclophilin family peptidyl-prolyl cis-trans isomerase
MTPRHCVLASIASLALVTACERINSQPAPTDAADLSVRTAIPADPGTPSPSVADILAASPATDWRTPDPDNLLYMELPEGRVIIELAENFAPNHTANVRALVREGYFRKGAVTRVQDNYVVQWAQAGDPPRPPKVGKERLDAEFTRPRTNDIPFTVLPDPDTYAPEVGFSEGFPAARDATDMWLAHCYGTVGVGRDNDENSGGGGELYAVIGQSPRGLDRNITVLGRVVQGMERLSSLPRGAADLGFYADPKEYVRFDDIRLASDIPEADRTPLEILRTDSATFDTLVNSRRWRRDDFYHRPVGRIGLCNINIPSRPAAS